MLYVVATPIGNLGDITIRAIDTLRSVDFVLSEDTRVTRKLLNHLEIKTPLISFHEHSKESQYENIINLLREGKNLALVTDAGTPAISDPGAFLIQRIREELPETEISPIPGASALITAISVSGINSKEFTFLGFPPHKKGRKTFFDKIEKIAEERPVIFYESKHRILKALDSLKEVTPERKIIIAKELTKIHEEMIFGTAEEVILYFEEHPDKIKGEFVVLVV